MILEQRRSFYSPPQFTGTVAGAANSPLLGTPQKFQIDRTYPLEEIILHVAFVVNAGTALTLVTAPQTPDTYENILQLIQHVNLSTNNGTQPRTVVDCSGVGLMEYALTTGTNLDYGTLLLFALARTGTLPSGNYQYTIRIPLVETAIGEPLRTQMYVPIHTYPQDPVLTLTFQNAASIYSAGNINSIAIDVELVRRLPTVKSEQQVIANRATNPNGYIDADLIETDFNIPLGVNTQQRFQLPIPGQYASLFFRHYFGGANITRNSIDFVAANFGNENIWDIESALTIIRNWKWKHLRFFSECQRDLPAILNPALFVAAASAGSPTTILQVGSTVANTLANPFIFGTPGSGQLAGNNFMPAVALLMDFMTDGMSGDDCVELGSLLNCNLAAGLKMEIVGNPTSVATNPSLLRVIGRRYFGDLSKWQKLR